MLSSLDVQLIIIALFDVEQGESRTDLRFAIEGMSEYLGVTNGIPIIVYIINVKLEVDIYQSYELNF